MIKIKHISMILFMSYATVFGSIIKLSDSPTVIRTVNLTDSFTEFELNIEMLNCTESETTNYIELPGNLYPGSGHISGPAGTVLPSYTVLVAIPEGAPLSVSILEDNITEINHFQLAACDKEDSQWVNPGISSDGYYPDNLYVFEYAGKMRDVNIARLTLYPVQYDYSNRQLKIHSKLRIRANHPAGNICEPGTTISEAFKPIYDAFLINSSSLDPTTVTRGQFWFVVPDNLVSNISQIVDWEKAKGFITRVIPLSSIGFNPSSTAIYNYLKSLYFGSNPKPDYICLIGDTQMPGGVSMPTYTYYSPWSPDEIDSDNYYSFIDGNDYFPDVFIGRISVSTAVDLTNYTAKYFGYERYPYMDDTTWYKKATVISGGEDNWFISPRQTKMWCREIMLDHGYTNVDTIFSTIYYDPPASSITASISAGVSLVNFRGYGYAEGWYSHSLWYTTNNLAQLSNGPKFAVMHSIVCATGDYNDGNVANCFGETWIRLANKGGPGFIGNTNHFAHTKWTNAIDCGIYWGLFQGGVHTLAQSELAGKMNLYLAFPGNTQPGDTVELYFNSYNDLGNPELNYWLGVPKTMTVVIPDTLGLGQAGVDIEIMDSQGNPVPNAYVCLWKGTQIFTGQFAENNSFVHFQIYTDSVGPIKVTVTAPSYIPFEGTIQVVDMPVCVGLNGYNISDDSSGLSRGNNNGAANPAETIELYSVVKNYGSSIIAESTNANLISIDPYVDVQSAWASYGNIASGDTSISQEPFVVHVSAEAPDNYRARFAMDIHAGQFGPWHNILSLPISAPDLNVTSVAIEGDNNGNHQLDRGETAQLIVSLMNQGSETLAGSRAVLRTSDSLIQIIDSIAVYPPIGLDSTVDNWADPFSIMLSPDIYDGHRIPFELKIDDLNGIRRTIPFAISVGVISADDPIGPDGYGYYCLDNTDISYQQHPVYDWIPIETSWPYVNIPDDDETTIALPFQVSFYGDVYDQITISDNGYIAMGATWWSNFQNAQIPGPQCAKAMIAGFWDDITNGSGGSIRVYYHHDPAAGKFIVGWRNVYVNDNNQWLTFEIIFLDESVWPTVTNDNDIIIQYATAVSCITNSVGICNYERNDGLQYMFNSILAPGAAPISNGRAIKFTTGSLYSAAGDEAVDVIPNDIGLSANYPNPFNSSTIIEYDVPRAGNVKIDIYDITGRKIKSLIDMEQPAGRQRVIWDGTGNSGAAAASGIYFYRLKYGVTDITRMMLLIK